MRLSIGDPIEVCRPVLLANCKIVQQWVPATVAYVDDDQLVAVFADHTRIPYARRQSGHIIKRPIKEPSA